MSLRFREIAEVNQRIQNPFSPDKLLRLAEICDVNKGTRILDLACGKGELLCQWALHHGIKGTGVDANEASILAAQMRSDDLKVWSQLNFVTDDPATYPQAFHQYDVISCIGASWLGGGLEGTLRLMTPALKDTETGLFIIGETFWQTQPPDEICEIMGIERDYLTDLGGISDRLDAAGVELVSMLISDRAEWDQYYADQWLSVGRWLQNNADDPDAEALQKLMSQSRQNYLKYERPYLGFGLFVLRIV